MGTGRLVNPIFQSGGVGLTEAFPSHKEKVQKYGQVSNYYGELIISYMGVLLRTGTDQAKPSKPFQSKKDGMAMSC